MDEKPRWLPPTVRPSVEILPKLEFFQNIDQSEHSWIPVRQNNNNPRVSPYDAFQNDHCYYAFPGPKKAYFLNNKRPPSKEELELRRQLAIIEEAKRKARKRRQEEAFLAPQNVNYFINQRKSMNDRIRSERRSRALALCNKRPAPMPSNEELELKRQLAIVEEAEKKARKRLQEEKMNEPRYIDLGRLICSLDPQELGILTEEMKNEEKGEEGLSVPAEQFLSNLGQFCNSLAAFLGPAAKGSILFCGDIFASNLSQTYRGAIADVNRRLENLKYAQKLKVLRMQERYRTAEQNRIQQREERLITIGRVICSLKPQDFFNLSSSSSQESSSSEPTNNLLAEHHPELIASRGEILMENVFIFCDLVGVLMGVHSKFTVFRNPNETTHRMCNVAEKSVRDRHFKRAKVEII